MKKKIVSIIVGLLAIAAIVFTGFLSFADKKGYSTVLYGIVTAIFVPVALALIQGAFQKPNKTLEELTKVPAIQQLLEEVRQYEVKVKALKDERDKLLEIIQKESRLYMLQERKASLEANMKSAQEEIVEIDALLKEEPNASYRYIPDIIKKIEKETHEPELNLEGTLLDTILSTLALSTSIMIGDFGWRLISSVIIKAIKAMKSKKKHKEEHP